MDEVENLPQMTGGRYTFLKIETAHQTEFLGANRLEKQRVWESIRSIYPAEFIVGVEREHKKLNS